MKRVNLYSIVSFSGVLINFVEIILHFFKSSLCEKESCRIVTSHTRFGDELFILSGFFVFLILFLLSRKLEKKQYGIYFDSILVVALSMEGYLVGFQFFRIKTFCSFCLSVFIVFLLLAVLRILGKNLLPLLGIASFSGVFIMMILILPAKSHFKIPDSKYTVIYSSGCPHCRNVIKFMREKKIYFNKITLNEAADFLVAVGLNEVPVLVEKEEGRVELLVGEKAIINHLKKIHENKYLPYNKDTCKFGIPCDQD